MIVAESDRGAMKKKESVNVDPMSCTPKRAARPERPAWIKEQGSNYPHAAVPALVAR